jgi:hypothetical protein
MLLIAPGPNDMWSEVFKCPSNQAKESHNICDFTVEITRCVIFTTSIAPKVL